MKNLAIIQNEKFLNPSLIKQTCEDILEYGGLHVITIMGDRALAVDIAAMISTENYLA